MKRNLFSMFVASDRERARDKVTIPIESVHKKYTRRYHMALLVAVLGMKKKFSLAEKNIYV